jgi:adenine-specific DNA-methyltransferase
MILPVLLRSLLADINRNRWTISSEYAESYEDTLNNLTLRRSGEQKLALEANPAFKENYMLSYMLDMESQDSLLNIRSFVHPFDYRLNIATSTVGETQPVTVDLVETFNYLIGLRVETIQSIRGFRVVTGRNPEGERTLIIRRDLEERSNADLETFFRKQDYSPRDMEFDLICVNGDNNLENLRRPDETWKVRLIEEEFHLRMFEETE